MDRKDFPSVNIIENSENRGFAAANNLGIASSYGRYVLLLNSDTIVLDGVISKMVAFADSHTEAAVVGCRVLNPDKTLQPTCFMFPSLLNLWLEATYLYKLFPQNRFFGREQMTWWNRSDAREVDVITGCCMLVRREAIEQVGMMDEKFFMYGEETDWCYRFKRAGWKVIFSPAGEIIHLGGQSTNRVREEMNIRLRTSILRFIKKHHGWFSHKAACLIMILFFVVRLPIWFCLSVAGGRRREQAAIRLRVYLRGIGTMIRACANLRGDGTT
jgi:GT2 family glycosyltransferase